MNPATTKLIEFADEHNLTAPELNSLLIRWIESDATITTFLEEEEYRIECAVYHPFPGEKRRAQGWVQAGDYIQEIASTAISSFVGGWALYAKENHADSEPTLAESVYHDLYVLIHVLTEYRTEVCKRLKEK